VVAAAVGAAVGVAVAWHAANSMLTTINKLTTGKSLRIILLLFSNIGLTFFL
jgi:hypothetical protein